MDERKKEIIFFASEIGQYHYCPISWFLLKKGYIPESSNLQNGVKKHQKYGAILDKKDTHSLISKYLLIGGIIGIILTGIYIILEVLI